MTAQATLRFKVANSIIISCLGIIMFARLSELGSLSVSTILALAVAATFTIAGAWRARIYLRALRTFSES